MCTNHSCLYLFHDHAFYIVQCFGFENGRRVINRSPWVGKGSCRRVKNHSLSVFQESYSDYQNELKFLKLHKCKPMEPVSITDI